MWVFEENYKSINYVWNSVPTYAGFLRKRFKVGFPIRKISKIFGNCMKYSRSVERKNDLAVNKAWPAGWLNNWILTVCRQWLTKYIQWLLWLQYNILKKYLAKLIYKLTKPVACRPIATRWLSAKRLVVRNVLISHAPNLRSKMRTDLKSSYTRWTQNYCPVKL